MNHDSRMEMIRKITDLEPGRYFFSYWTEEDIYDRAYGMDLELTEDEMEQVMYLMEKCYDAEVGMTWRVVTEHIKHVVGEREDEEPYFGIQP